MEMDSFYKNHHTSKQFKIDLIVWKYKVEGLLMSEPDKFKIDLIVWK